LVLDILRQQNSRNAHKECWGTGGCLNTQEWYKLCWLHGNIKGANHSAYEVAGSWERRELTGGDREYLPSLDRVKPVSHPHHSLYRINVAHPTRSNVVTKPLFTGALKMARSIIK